MQIKKIYSSQTIGMDVRAQHVSIRKKRLLHEAQQLQQR